MRTTAWGTDPTLTTRRSWYGGTVALRRVPTSLFFSLFPPSAQLSENGIIGQGNFGVVHKGMCRGAQVAVKIPKVEDLSAEKLEEFRAELK
jgi:hypothetical protein